MRLGIVIAVGLMALGPSQEIREAASLERILWGQTQLALAKVFPRMHRDAGYGGTPVFVVEVARRGSVTAGVLLESSGDEFLDAAARSGLQSFRFASPVEAGAYRLAVPMIIDSLLPPEPLRPCLPAGALIHIVRSSWYRWRNSNLNVRAPGVPEYKPTYLVTIESDLPPASRCREMLAGWPDDYSRAQLSDLTDVAFCERGTCPTLFGDVKDIPIRLANIRMNWIDEWTFEVANGGGTGPWVFRCTSERECNPLRRPRFPIGDPAT